MVLQQYVTQLILSYARRYIRNIEANLSLSLWGGDVVLNNLDIRLDVLQRELGVPREFEFSRGFIKELRIHIPWASLTSRPVEVTFTDVECVLHFKTHVGDYSGGGAGQDANSSTTTAVSSRRPRANSATGAAPPKLEAAEAEEVGGSGWAAELVTKILANLTLRINGLSFNFVEQLQAQPPALPATPTPTSVHLASPPLPLVPAGDREIMLSLRIVQLLIESTSASGAAQVVELEGPWKCLHKVLHLKHASIHLGELSQVPLSARATGGVTVKDGVSINRPVPRVLADADDATILKDLSCTLRIRTYLASLAGASMIRLPQVGDPPPPPSGNAISLDLEMEKPADFYLSDQQMQFLLHIVQTKAAFVSAASSSSTDAAASDDDDAPPLAIDTHARRSSAPAVITASSLQHLTMEPNDRPPVMVPTPTTTPPPATADAPPPPRRSTTKRAASVSSVDTTVTTTTATTPPADGSATPSASAAAPVAAAPASRGWTAWVWDMVAEEDSETEEEEPVPVTNPTQDFWTMYGHLAPRPEISVACHLPAVTLHLLHPSRQKLASEGGVVGVKNRGAPDSLLTVRLERIHFTQRRPRAAPAHPAATAAASGPQSTRSRSTPLSNAGDDTSAVARAAAVSSSRSPPVVAAGGEGSIRIGDINVLYSDRGELRPMFTWLAHGHPCGPGIAISTSAAPTSPSSTSAVLVGEWSASMRECEVFAFDLFVSYALLRRVLDALDPIMRRETKSKTVAAPPVNEARSRAAKRYRPNHQTLKVVLHAGRVRIAHVPTSRNEHEHVAASAQWQIVHLLSAATQCEEPHSRHAVLADTLELRVVDLSVSVERAEPALSTSSSSSSRSHARVPSFFALMPPTAFDPSSICLAPLTCVVQIARRAKVLTVDPTIARYVHALAQACASAGPISPSNIDTTATGDSATATTAAAPSFLMPFYRDTHVCVRVQRLNVTTDPDQLLRMVAIAEAFRRLAGGARTATASSTTATTTTTSTASSAESSVAPVHAPSVLFDPLLLRQCRDDFRQLQSTGVTPLPSRPRAGHLTLVDAPDASRSLIWKYASPRALTRISVEPPNAQIDTDAEADADVDAKTDAQVAASVSVANGPLLVRGLLSAWDPVSCVYKAVREVLVDLRRATVVDLSSTRIVSSEWRLVFTRPTPTQARLWAQRNNQERDEGQEATMEAKPTEATAGTAAMTTAPLPSASYLARLLRIDSQLHLRSGTNVHVALSIAKGRVSLSGRDDDGDTTDLVVVHLKGLHAHLRLWQAQALNDTRPQLGVGTSIAARLAMEAVWINSHQHAERAQYPLVLPMRVVIGVRQNNLIRQDDADATAVAYLPASLCDEHPSLAGPSAAGWSMSWDRTKLTVLTQLLVAPKLISHRIQAFLDYLPSSVSRAADQIIASTGAASYATVSSMHAATVSAAAAAAASSVAAQTPAYYIPHHPSGLPDPPSHSPSSPSFSWSRPPSLSWLHHPPPLADARTNTRWCVDLARLQADRPAVTIVVAHA